MEQIHQRPTAQAGDAQTWKPFFGATWRAAGAAVGGFLNPCGQIMDYLRSCYTAEVRYLAGSQARGYITWEKAQPGAQVYPYPHAFSSSVWENNDPSSFGPIGETSMAR